MGNDNQKDIQPVSSGNSQLVYSQDCISIVDIFSAIKSKLIWFCLLWVGCFFVSFLAVYFQNQKVVFKQLVSLPTIINKDSLQRVPLFTISGLLDNFYAQDVLYWQQYANQYLNATFEYTPNFSTQQADGSGASNELMLSIIAPLKDRALVEKLFSASVSSLQQLVQIKLGDWQSAMQARIKIEEELLGSLQAAMNFQGKANLNSEAADVAISQARMQNKLIDIQKEISEQKWLMSTVKAEVKPVGHVYISRSKAMLMVFVRSFLIATLVALVLIFFISSAIANFRLQSRRQS